MTRIAPSILAANTLRLGEAACLVRDCGCDELHFDVMDGHFVPNLSFGPGLLADLKREYDLSYDVHLMMTDPLGYVKPFHDAGACCLTVHREANAYEETINAIRQAGMRAGASLKPHTPTETLRSYLGMLDRVLLMTVEPGFGGQKLMPEVLKKAKELRALGFQGDIEADGGITLENAPQLAAAGINTLVMGTAFFKTDDPAQLVRRVHEL